MAVLESELESELKPEVAASSSDRAWQHYYRLRPQIETPENIGRLILFDVDSGDYEIANDDLGFEAANTVRERHPDANMFCLRIGYETAASFCGWLERLPE